jgi:Asp-tRNA(Asn)/Glu-tRNA(Gln) amidotransferase A subunit family amidase
LRESILQVRRGDDCAPLSSTDPHDIADVSGYHQPEAHLDGFDKIEDLSDLRVGVYWPYFRDATPDIVSANERALELLKAKGAKIVDISLPHLQATDKAHKVCIMTEFATGMQSFWKKHENDIPGDARLSIILGRSFSGKEYLAAQKVRKVAFWRKNVYVFLKELVTHGLVASASC